MCDRINNITVADWKIAAINKQTNEEVKVSMRE